MSLITPDFGLIFWMTIIFATVFFILAKFGFPIITGMVEKRNARIADSIAEAEKAERKIQSLYSDQLKIIEETRRQQAQILKEASEAKENILTQAHVQAQEEATKLVSEARTLIEAEKESALRDIRSQVAKLSVSVAGKVLRENLSTEEAQIALIDKMVDEISSNPSKLN